MLVGCADKFERAAQYATQSEGMLASGDLNGARFNIQQAIVQRDDVAAFYIILGRIENQAQRPISAFNAFSLALDLESDNLEVLQNIADIGLQTGRVSEAEEAANRILLLAPASTGAILVKGFIAIDAGRYDDAQAAVDDILDINPQDEGGAILAARIDALQGNSAGALAKIDRSIATIGATSALNVTRLEILRALGNRKAMAEVFPLILKDMNNSPEFRLDYINLLYKGGDRQLARRQGYSLLRDQPNSRVELNKLYSLWTEYDDNPLSKSALDVIAASGSRVTRITLARHYYTQGSFDIASRLLAGALGAGIDEAEALNALIMIERGQKRQAVAVAARILESDSRNEDALLVRIEQSMNEKNYDRAIEDANVVVSDAPLNIMGHVALARAYSAKGADIRARQTFEKAMDLLPQSVSLASFYAEFLVGRGDTDRVLTLGKEVAIASPSSTRAWTNFMVMCRRFGDVACANTATAGLARANASYIIDEPPGTPRRRGLFARITPEKICSTTGGICTDS